jgi:hypothetical protein
MKCFIAVSDADDPIGMTSVDQCCSSGCSSAVEVMIGFLGELSFLLISSPLCPQFTGTVPTIAASEMRIRSSILLADTSRSATSAPEILPQITFAFARQPSQCQMVLNGAADRIVERCVTFSICIESEDSRDG